MNGDKPTTIFDLIDRQFKELPVHKRFQKLENLISEEINDALTDLSEEEINIVSIYYSFVKFLGENNVSTIEYLLNRKLSLMRSRDRLGRQEYLQGLKETKEVIIPPQPIPHFSEDEKRPVTTEKVSFIRKLFGGRRR